MLFYEYSFLFVFLPVALGTYYALPMRMRNGWLFVASCAFYAVSSAFFLPVLLTSTALDYWVGRRLVAARSQRARRAFLTCSIAVNLSLLGFFKYAGFFSGVLRDELGLASFPAISVALPVGISFYTFQSMSYSIDLYRGRAERSKSFIDFACFVTLYPQLIAGPIVRYSEVAAQLVRRDHCAERFADGIHFFVRGLAKKILLADSAAFLCDPIFAVGAPGFIGAWVSTLLYATQIYFDFSGYSDMAVGLGKMIGFEFPQNFNSPYKATSFSEFWRRWHITLSTWLRDNLYIPLGGGRRGSARTYVNLAATMLLGGLWHGAAWNFVLWGAYHGGLLALERALGLASVASEGARMLWPRRVLVFLAVTIGWVFFRCEDLDHSVRWLKAMFLLDGLGGLSVRAVAGLLPLLAIALLTRNTWEIRRSTSLRSALWLVVLFTASLAVAYGKGSSPFLYFRF